VRIFEKKTLPWTTLWLQLNLSLPHSPSQSPTPKGSWFLFILQGLSLWDDGTSRNDVSPYELSGTPGPLYEFSRKHNVPALIHPCNFAPTKTYRLMHNDKEVSNQGHCVPRDDSFGDQGFPERSDGDTSFRDFPSAHQILHVLHYNVLLYKDLPPLIFSWLGSISGPICTGGGGDSDRFNVVIVFPVKWCANVMDFEK
jgi:hypothetical protein